MRQASSSRHPYGADKASQDMLRKPQHESYQKDLTHQIRRRSSASSMTSTTSSTKSTSKKKSKPTKTTAALRINTRSANKRPLRVPKERKVFSPSDLHESSRRRRMQLAWSGSSSSNSMEKKQNKMEEMKKYPYKMIEMSIKNQLKRLKHLLHFVQVYEAQGWSATGTTSTTISTSENTKLKPNTELENAHEKIVKGKRMIMDSLQKLVSFYGNDKQFDFLADDCANVQPEDIFCSHCFQTETNEDNDILLCDFEGCNRAYHQKCQDPPIETKDIPIDDEEWYCHICEAIFQCLREINFVFDTEYEDIKDVFPELPVEEEILSQERHEINKLRQQMLLEEEEDEEDEDFDSDEIDSDDDGSDSSDSSDSESDEEDEKKQQQQQQQQEDDAVTTCEEEVSEEEMAYLKSASSDAIIDLNKRTLRSDARTKKLLEEIGAEEEDLIDTNLILQGKRKRTNVDYCALNELLFSGKNDSDVEEGEEYVLKEKEEEEKEEKEKGEDEEDEEYEDKLSEKTERKQTETITSGRSKRRRTTVDYCLLHGGVDDEIED